MNFFEPIIGNSFSDVGAQRAGYNRFNAGIEEANIGRAAQAQQERNTYFARLAQIQDNEAARADAQDLGLQQYAIARSDKAQAIAEDARRFGIDSGIKRDQIAEENKHWDFSKAMRTDAESKALSATENFAKTKVDDVNDIGQQHDAALTAFGLAQQAEKNSIPSIEASHPLVRYEPRKKEFVMKGSAPVEVAKDSNALAAYNNQVAAQIEAANTAHAEAQAALLKATTDYGSVRESWRDIQKELNTYNLTPKRLGKLWGVYSPHPDHDRTWAPRITPASVLPVPQRFDMGSRAIADEASMPEGSSYFTQGTGTTPPPEVSPAAVADPVPAPALSGPVKRGRFIVTPIGTPSAPTRFLNRAVMDEASLPASVPAPISAPSTLGNQGGGYFPSPTVRPVTPAIAPVETPAQVDSGTALARANAAIYGTPKFSGFSGIEPQNRATQLKQERIISESRKAKLDSVTSKVQAMSLDQLYALKNALIPDAKYNGRTELEKILIQELGR